MCGIAGILKFNGNSVQEAEVRCMTDILHHRGPDGNGQWISPSQKTGLGHTRLSIIDLSDLGKQPMHYAERYTITFNGEIYNYIELRENLIKKGYSFKSRSDTEVLLALYDQKKEHCLDELDGMFAFAIWDEKEQTLFCARDRFGEKPFYYFFDSNNQFVFASEMKALFAYGIPKKVNNAMLYNYLTDGWIENPHNLSETFYEQVYKLEAAHFLKIENNTVVKKKYWSIDLNIQSTISFDDACEKFKVLFNESIKNRLRSDVSVGSSLSGGLDSSTIVCAVNALGHSSQKTFSASFPGFEKDETKYMNMVANATKVQPYFTIPTAETLVNDIDKLFYHQEEPFVTSSIFAQWEVMKLAHKESTIVLLDGQGADEVLAGYTFYYRLYFQELYATNKKEFRSQYKAYKEWGGNHFPFDTSFKLQARFPKAYYNYLKLRWKPLVHTDVNRDFYDAYKKKTYAPQTFEPSLNFNLHRTLCQGGLGTLLRYSDRNAMAFSREVRLPFLYHKLVEFVYSLPSTYKIHNGWSKYLVRKSFNAILPAEIAWRKDKIGYAPPEQQWLANPHLKEKINNSIEQLSSDGILDKKNLDTNKTWTYLMTSKLLLNG